MLIHLGILNQVHRSTSCVKVKGQYVPFSAKGESKIGKASQRGRCRQAGRRGKRRPELEAVNK